MHRKYSALVNANAIVFASPLFFSDHFTAQTKAFIEWLYSFYWMKTLDTDKKAVININYEWSKPEVFNGMAECISKRVSSYY